MGVFGLRTSVEDRIEITTQMKRVSVVIPISRKDRASEAIQSVLSQDYPQELIDIIAVGKGSRLLKERWPMIQAVDVGPILQPGKARNLGAVRATGEVIIFLDDDCEAQPGWVEENLAELERDDVGAVSGMIAGKSTGFFARCADLSHFGASQTNRRGEGRLWTASFAIRRALFEELGGFNEEVRVLENIDLSFRLKRRGLKTIHQPKVQVLHSHDSKTFKDLLKDQWSRGKHAGLLIERQHRDLSLRNRALAKAHNPFAYALLVLPFALAETLSITAGNLRQHPDVLLRMPFILLSKISYHMGIWHWCWQRWINSSPTRQGARSLLTYSLLKGRFQSPRILTLFVTSTCNAKCSHCSYDDSIGDGNDLTLDELEHLSLQVGPLDKLLIAGGEPFLRRDLADICRLFFRNSEVGAVSIPTNGMRPYETYNCLRVILEASKGRPVTISFSVEGAERAHDRIRGVPGSYRRLSKTYRRVRSLTREFPNLILRVQTTITDENDAAVHDLALLPGVHSPSIKLLRGTPQDSNHGLPSNERIRELFEFKTASCPGEQSSLRRLADRLTFEVAMGNLERATQVVPCEAGRILGTVDHDGSVRPCELLPPIGNVRQTSFAEIWNSVDARKVRTKIARKSCSCTNECYAFPSLMANPLQVAKVLAMRPKT
jgi:MoaA/NifB/PqqE/SkfB family radical SAM enzyme/GT2 family glycosyltransferase